MVGVGLSSRGASSSTSGDVSADSIQSQQPSSTLMMSTCICKPAEDRHPGLNIMVMFHRKISLCIRNATQSSIP